MSHLDELANPNDLSVVPIASIDIINDAITSVLDGKEYDFVWSFIHELLLTPRIQHRVRTLSNLSSRVGMEPCTISRFGSDLGPLVLPSVEFEVSSVGGTCLAARGKRASSPLGCATMGAATERRLLPVLHGGLPAEKEVIRQLPVGAVISQEVCDQPWGVLGVTTMAR